MSLKNIENWTFAQLDEDIANGGRFVVFTYTISVLILTFKRSSDICYIKAGHQPISKGWPYLLLSLLLGWWGFSWGPIYTIGSIINAFTGNDVTYRTYKMLLQQAQGTADDSSEQR